MFRSIGSRVFHRALLFLSLQVYGAGREGGHPLQFNGDLLSTPELVGIDLWVVNLTI
jgi:hypothetical protein